MTVAIAITVTTAMTVVIRMFDSFYIYLSLNARSFAEVARSSST